ncbi:MAG: hypothetical protein Kow00109_28030 [Acidobacteriota bacterium]
MRNAAAGRDLVFLDRDNGIEMPLKPGEWKDSSKYVTSGEIEPLWEAGCSLPIYQHFPRQKRREFAEHLLATLCARTGARLAVGLRTPLVLFLLASQEHHEPWLLQGVQRCLARWEPHRPTGGTRAAGGMTNQCPLYLPYTPCSACSLLVPNLPPVAKQCPLSLAKKRRSRLPGSRTKPR